jgi:hypothetical protein
MTPDAAPALAKRPPVAYRDGRGAAQSGRRPALPSRAVCLRIA